MDLKRAINAVSEVVQNRPRPLREFDQIFMKTGDMVLQSELVANWSDQKRVAFIGDGDAISVAVAYLNIRESLQFGPSKITVYDFDERTVAAVKRFADKERLKQLDAKLYNVLDPFPNSNEFDCFYTNPPWGASNNDESANVFIQRGIEAIGYVGDGLIVLADDHELEWTKHVLSNVQNFSASKGFYVSRKSPSIHAYHLDDAPDLMSCNLFISSVPGNENSRMLSKRITESERLQNFYGRSLEPRVKYVRELSKPDYGRAPQEEYRLEYLEEEETK